MNRIERIEWHKGVSSAMEDVSGGTRLPLIFFHNPADEASRKLLGEVLVDEKVVQLVEREFSPVMVDTVMDKETVKRFRVDWTPAFIVLDEQGKEIERFVGYLPAMELEAQLLLSKGLALFHMEKNLEAVALFEEIVEHFADSDLIPEVEYFLGAASFKVKGDSVKLVEISHILTEKYPDSIWTKRCAPWAHLRIQGPFVGYDGGGSGGSGAY